MGKTHIEVTRLTGGKELVLIDAIIRVAKDVDNGNTALYINEGHIIQIYVKETIRQIYVKIQNC